MRSIPHFPTLILFLKVVEGCLVEEEQWCWAVSLTVALDQTASVKPTACYSIITVEVTGEHLYSFAF